MRIFTKKRLLALGAFLLSTVLMVSYLSVPVEVLADDIKDEIAQREATLKDLSNQRKAIESQINATKSEKEKEQATKNYLDAQISITSSEIATLEEKIALQEELILEKQAEIDEKQEEHDQNYELFRQRIKAMYMYDDTTTLGLVLGAEGFVDFLTKTDTVVRVADHDRALLAELTAEREELERSRRDLEDVKDNLEVTKQENEEKKSSLASQQQAAAIRIQDLAEMEKEFQADKAKIQAREAAVQSEINDLYAKLTWGDFAFGGEMAWPVNGYYTISSDYGWRFGGSDFHTGIDIAGQGPGGGIYGQPIRAASVGQVKVTNYTYTPGRGYGIYVILDHGLKDGNSYSTLYGHMSSIGSISVGDWVQPGDVIGYVGSTGWSTGPHLHFEVRINGKWQNPRPYLGI